MGTALSAALVAVAGVPVGAHGPTATFAVQATPDRGDPTTVEYRVRLTYDNDGEPVEGATVVFQAVGSGPDAAFAPEDMSETDPGEYELTETFPGPGTYTVTISSEDPAATYEDTITVGPPTSTTTTGDSTTPTDAPEASAADDDDGTTIAWVVILVVILVVAALGGALALARRRRRAG